MAMPLTVIGGFLGAGKTTLLNRILAASDGRRLAVLVNDFGAINVDAALVASRSADIVALTNGCVCCSIGDDLSAALIRVLDASPAFDAVVIEASGVSDPWQVAQIGRADPALCLDAVVVLVDAGAVLAQAQDPRLADSLQRQLRAADLIVVNKTDLANAGQLQRVRDWLDEAVRRHVPRIETCESQVPLQMLSDAGLPSLQPRPLHVVTCGCRACAPEARHDEAFETWSRRAPGVMSAGRLRAAIERMPPGVLRLKGLVRTDELGWSELQFAGRHGRLRRADPATASAAADHGGAMVAIGLRGALPRRALDDLFSEAEVGCEEGSTAHGFP